MIILWLDVLYFPLPNQSFMLSAMEHYSRDLGQDRFEISFLKSQAVMAYLVDSEVSATFITFTLGFAEIINLSVLNRFQLKE